MDLIALTVFALALVLNSGSPGPSILALVSRVIARGWRDVMPFVAAMWIGEVLWLTMAMLGLSELAERFHEGFLMLKYAGVAYLLWLAWRMWHEPVATEAHDLPKRSGRWPMFAAGMALTLGNPKIVVFYLALLPTLIDLQTVSFDLWAVVAAITVVCLAAVDLCWIALAHRARALLRTPRAVRVANRIGATAMCGAAAAIASR